MAGIPGRKKVTSPRVAREAAKQLRSRKTPPVQKSVAGSAVAQARGKRRQRA